MVLILELVEPPKLVGEFEVPEPAFKIVNVPIGLRQLPPGGFRRSAFSGEPHVGSLATSVRVFGPPPNTRAFPPPSTERFERRGEPNNN
jgi:hypothetical protein